MRKVLSVLIVGPKRIVDALFGYDFFISYAHNDGKEYPEALDRALSKDYTVHLDSRDYQAGKDIHLLTRMRVRNSRILVVVGRPTALTRSYWVRREVEMFHDTGREPVIINIDGAVDAALNAPPEGSLAAWLAARCATQGDGTRVNPILLEHDKVQPCMVGARLPHALVIGRIQARFTGDRVETRRLRIVSGALIVLVLAMVVAVWQSIIAGVEREAALHRLRVATAHLLTSRAEDAAEDGEHHLSLLLARASLERHGTLDGDRALRAAMGRVPEPVGVFTHEVARPDVVDTISFSPSGSYLATASGATLTSGGHTKVWRTDTLQAVEIEIGAPGPAYFSPVEDLLVVGSDEQVLRLIEIPTGKVRRTIRYNAPVVVPLAIESQGRYVVTHNYAVGEFGSVEDKNTLDIIDLKSGQVFATIEPSSTTGYSWGQAFFFTRGGATFLAAGWGQNQTDEWRFTGDGLEYHSVPGALSRNGKWVLISSESRPGFRVVHADDPTKAAVEGDTTVRNFQFSPYGDFLALSDRDDRLFLWDIAAGRRQIAGTLRLKADSVIFSRDGKLFTSDRSTKVWNSYSGEVMAENFASEEEVPAQSVNFRRITEKQVGQAIRTTPAHGFAFSPASDRVYTKDEIGNVFVWRPVATSHIKEVRAIVQASAAALAADGNRVLVGSYEGVSGWDFEIHAPAHESERPVRALAFDLAGQQYAFSTDPEIVSDEEPGVHVVAADGERRFLPFTGRVLALAFNAAGKLAIAASASQFVATLDAGIWIADLRSGERRVVDDNVYTYYDLEFHPTRNWLGIASGDGSRIVDLATGADIAVTGWAEHITFSADGHFAALHDRDSVWVLQLNAEEVYVETGRLPIDARPSSVAFDATGRLLAIGSHVKGVGIWDWRQKRELARIPAQDKVLLARFLPGQPSKVVVVEEHGLTLSFWRREELLPQSESRALRGLSESELRRYLGDAPE